MKAINKTKTTKKHSKLHRWMVPAVLAALVAVGSPAVSQAEAPTQNAPNYSTDLSNLFNNRTATDLQAEARQAEQEAHQLRQEARQEAHQEAMQDRQMGQQGGQQGQPPMMGQNGIHRGGHQGQPPMMGQNGNQQGGHQGIPPMMNQNGNQHGGPGMMQPGQQQNNSDFRASHMSDNEKK